MRTLINETIVAAAIILFCTACNKEPVGTNTQPPPLPKEEVTKENVVGSYLITKVETTAGGNRSDITETWFRQYAGDCSKDDVTQFKPDNSFVVRDGTITCDESTDDTGTWDVIDATHLRWDNDTTTIEAFTGTLLRIVSPVYSTAQGAIIFTYTRQ
jgi:hypothetical protein